MILMINTNSTNIDTYISFTKMGACEATRWKLGVVKQCRYEERLGQ